MERQQASGMIGMGMTAKDRICRRWMMRRSLSLLHLGAIAPLLIRIIAWAVMAAKLIQASNNIPQTAV
jgi:hypothetical protein